MTVLVEQLPASLTTSSSSSCAGPQYEFDYSYADGRLSVRKLGTPPCFDVAVRLELPTKLNTAEIVATIVAKLAADSNTKTPQSSSRRFEYLAFDVEFGERLGEFVLRQTQAYYDSVCLDALKSFQSFINSPEEEARREGELGHELFKMNLRASNIKTYWHLINTRPFKLTNQAIRLNEDARTLKCDYLLLDVDETQLKQEQLFAKMYHHLMHSDAMLRLLEKERQFTIEYNAFLNEKEQTIRFLQEAYEANLNDKLKPENTYSDKYITELAKSNLESIELEKAKWQSRANALKAAQQRKFRRFIQLLYDKKMAAAASANGESSSNTGHDDGADIDDLINDDVHDAVYKPTPRPPLGISGAAGSGKTPALQRATSTAAGAGAGARLQTSASLRDFKKLNSMRSESKLEESYTIQLGAQLKTTHNLRLIRCDILDYCQDRFNTQASAGTGGKAGDFLDFIEPHSIQTAMSLYSDKLCAVVLLISNSFETTRLSLGLSSSSSSSLKDSASSDSNNNSAGENGGGGGGSAAPSSEISARFYEICERNGSDFHFQPLEQQIEVAAHWCESIHGGKSTETTTASAASNKLNVGDFFVTKHSNLSQVHIMFHLACFDADSGSIAADNSTGSAASGGSGTMKKSDLSSRHPVILGLRNVLKICVANNINTLTFPLLLTHEMNEEMTISWVMKRAELVLKCIKGFMIELVQWGAQDSKTLQFVVPKGLLDETFHSLSNLIKTIFRESRTVDLV